MKKRYYLVRLADLEQGRTDVSFEEFKERKCRKI